MENILWSALLRMSGLDGLFDQHWIMAELERAEIRTTDQLNSEE